MAEKQSPQNAWKATLPPDRAWKGRKGRTRAAQAKEQDQAAGGRHRRFVDLGDGRIALASVSLRIYGKTRRIRATLRWGDGEKSPDCYLGEVDHATRAENLAEAWARAWERGLLVEEPMPSSSTASSRAVRASMRGNRGKDTKPELRLRSLLHNAGLRYRVNAKPISGLRRSVDIVFPRQRVAVFVDGCFWHVCPEHHRAVKKNVEFWRPKLERNQERDAETTSALQSAGWTVVRVWEHEEPEEAAQRVIDVISPHS